MDQSSFEALGGPQFAFYSVELWTTAKSIKWLDLENSKITGDSQNYERNKPSNKLLKVLSKTFFHLFLQNGIFL